MKQPGQAEQIERLKKEAISQMMHYHERNSKQKVKDGLKKIAGRYVPPRDIISWPTGLLINALTENYEIWEEKPEILEAWKGYFDRWIGEGMPVYYIDDVLCGTSLLDLYELTGEEKYLLGADKMAQYLYAIKDVDKAGSIPYRPSQKNYYIFVDGIGMMCPFLCRYGIVRKDQRAVELSVKQLENMLEYGMDERIHLPYHGFQYESGMKYGIIGWGRAAGWLLMGMAGVLANLPKEHPAYKKIKDSFGDIVNHVLRYQQEDGAFSWQIEAMEGPKDSSATAMITKAVIMGISCGISGVAEEAQEHNGKSWKLSAEKAAEYLAGCEKDGKIYQCSGECMGFSQYPQVYGAYPWSLGPALAVLREVSL